jgi:outer membrane protein assembly factor BamD (BamD/ComL family)
MKKKSTARTVANDDDLEIPELPRVFFKNAVRGKYYAKAMQGSNVVRIAPDLVQDFPNEEVVNEALRLVKQLRQVGKTRSRKTA